MGSPEAGTLNGPVVSADDVRLVHQGANEDGSERQPENNSRMGTGSGTVAAGAPVALTSGSVVDGKGGVVVDNSPLSSAPVGSVGDNFMKASSVAMSNGPSYSLSSGSRLSSEGSLRFSREGDGEVKADHDAGLKRRGSGEGGRVAGWLKPSPSRPANQDGENRSAWSAGGVVRAVDWKNNSARKSTALARASGVGSSSGGGDSSSGGGGSCSGAIPEEPKIRVPRPELLGAVVARLAVRRGSPDDPVEEGALSSGGEGGGAGGSEGEYDSGNDGQDGDEQSEEIEEEDERGDDNEGTNGDKKRRRKKRKGDEAVVVREAVVSEFDGIGGRYILVNSHGEEERMNLEELETALKQSQVRGTMMSPWKNIASGHVASK